MFIYVYIHVHTYICVCTYGSDISIERRRKFNTKLLCFAMETCSSRSDRNLRRISVLLYCEFINRQQATELHCGATLVNVLKCNNKQILRYYIVTQEH